MNASVIGNMKNRSLRIPKKQVDKLLQTMFRNLVQKRRKLKKRRFRIPSIAKGNIKVYNLDGRRRLDI